MVLWHIALEEKTKSKITKSEKQSQRNCTAQPTEGSLAHYLLPGQPLLAPLPANKILKVIRFVNFLRRVVDGKQR